MRPKHWWDGQSLDKLSLKNDIVTNHFEGTRSSMTFRETYLEIISGQRRGLVAACTRCVLEGLESLYSAGSAIRNLGFDKGWRTIHRTDVPVVSVGNLTTGGTGKTPIVATVVRMLQQLDRQPGIVSRGYHADDTGINDEKRVLSRLCPDVPHLQNADRVAVAKRIVSEFEVDTVVLDDGFQHRRLGRDLNIVLVDATNPFGYEHLLPRGLLRESINSLRRADLILITRCNQVSDEQLHTIGIRISSIVPDKDRCPIRITFRPDNLLDTSGRKLSVENVDGQRVMVVTAIGNPHGFVETCCSLGAGVVCNRFFPDHYHYTSKDLDSILAQAERHQVETILTTVKDLVKLQTLANADSKPPILAVEISTRFDSPDAEQTMLAAIEHAVTPNSAMKE